METVAPTFFAVAVAWARKAKFAAVNVVERYDENTLFSDVPATRDWKYGVAVMRARVCADVHEQALKNVSDVFAYHSTAEVLHNREESGSSESSHRLSCGDSTRQGSLTVSPLRQGRGPVRLSEWGSRLPVLAEWGGRWPRKHDALLAFIQ